MKYYQRMILKGDIIMKRLEDLATYVYLHGAAVAALLCCSLVSPGTLDNAIAISKTANAFAISSVIIFMILIVEYVRYVRKEES